MAVATKSLAALFGCSALLAAAASLAPAGFDGPFPGVVVNASLSDAATSWSSLGFPRQPRTVAACAAACLAAKEPPCISFNFPNCELNGWSRNYLVMDSSEPGVTTAAVQHFNILAPRNSSAAAAAIRPLTQAPTSGVELLSDTGQHPTHHPQVFRDYFDRVVPYLLGYNEDDLLYFFRLRALTANGSAALPAGHDRINTNRGCTSPNERSAPACGWDNDGPDKPYGLRGSLAGLVLMGTGGALRWGDSWVPEAGRLRALQDAIVAGIKANVDPATGYMMAFPYNESIFHENPDYGALLLAFLIASALSVCVV